MLKIRITHVENAKGIEERDRAIEQISKSFEILNQSKPYKGRNGSKYTNIYLDVEEK